MIRRSTWIVVGVFVVFVGLSWYLQKYKKEGVAGADTTPTPAMTYLFRSASADLVTGLQVVGPEGKTMTLNKAPDGTWMLEEPSLQPADAVRVTPVINTASTLRILSELEIQPALDDLGLQPPQYQLKLTLADGEKQVAYIGNATPIGSGYYTRLEGGQVVVVNKASLDSILGLYSTPPIAPTPTPEQVTPTIEATVTAQP
jgi:hypothetical protein